LPLYTGYEEPEGVNKMEDSYGLDSTFDHPCFDAKSCGSTGRIHLPVAPRCDIQCNYCSRKYDCANESRPGVTSRVISPQEAVELVKNAVRLEPRIKVVGIAGPGDPLSNEETFTAMSLVKQEFPHLTLCLSTNGLLLPDNLERLTDTGLDYLTVTVNTLNADTGSRIYSHVTYDGRVLKGIEAAAALLDNQIKGISGAVNKGINVKVNSVLLPGINENEMVSLAQTFRDVGVSVMNIMPLIPQAKFADLPPVSPEIQKEIRRECAVYIPQIYHCRQCRADAVGLLDNDLSGELAMR
jgi:nitrogen fixation protein NifB